ncbi:MAG: hypothetical protein J5U17_00020 [Candidatus Methanoperedens sp.]|nr:hypothetical protein [Candidatus Methanoperedens sp.]
MKKTISMILIISIISMSGCISGDSNTPVDIQKFERQNKNLDAKIVDIRFDRDDIRAGEKVTAELLIDNTGSENITGETIEIKAKVKTLDDFLANLALMIMSEEKKSKTYSMDFDTGIKPGTNGKLSAVFHTIQELEGRNLSGTYDITITLSVNGQKVDARVLPLTLLKGTPREFTPVPTPSPTSTPTSTPTPDTPAVTVTQEPAAIPEPVEVNIPTGYVNYTRIYNSYIDPQLKLNAGDAVEWNNIDDTTYTLVEMDNKISNITLKDNRRYRLIFNRTGDYHFKLLYSGLRTAPTEQEIIVRYNPSALPNAANNATNKTE